MTHLHPTTGPPGVSSVTRSHHPAPDGFAAVLEDRAGDQGWHTRWRLTWRPVPEALAYAVHLVGVEGADPVPRLVTEPSWEIEVACGPGPVVDPAIRAEQLGAASAGLQVCVVACFADTASPPGPLCAVGSPV